MGVSSLIKRCLTIAIVAALGYSAWSQSGVAPSVLSLPSGPGAIEGLGASYEPQLNTGTASYSLEVSVPGGVAGHTPSVSLSYDGGGGNGPLGIGWSLVRPRISRQVDKGIPKYTGASPADPATEDVFIYNGEELIPLSDGTYRCENETEFVRFRKVVGDRGDAIIAWEATRPDGSQMIFGANSNARVTRLGGGEGAFSDVYCWELSSDTDTNGNPIVYRYDRFEPESLGRAYLTEIEYARFGTNISYRVEFLYSGSEAYPEPRPDVLSDFRPGFECRTSKLLREIRILTDGALTRWYRLAYQRESDLAPSGASVVESDFSLLRRVTEFDRGGSDDNYLPPTRFAYSSFELTPASSPFSPISGGFNFMRFGPTQTTAMDINADALPDLVSSSMEGWFAYLNQGDGRFSDEVPFNTDGSNGAGDATGKLLSESALALADFDGDGITDLFHKAPTSARILIHRNLNDFGQPSTLNAREVVRWGPEETYATEAETGGIGTLGLNDPSIRLLDINFDKRIDIMRPFDFGDGSGGVEYLFNEPSGWRSELVFPGDPRLPEDWSPDEARFDRRGLGVTGLADFNGDRLEDWYVMARVGTQIWVDYWPNANGGFWGERTAAARIETAAALPSEVWVLDINADGLSDLARVDNYQLTVWVNLGSGAWSAPVIRDDAPFYEQGMTVLRFMDVNGNGTTDLVWDNSAVAPERLPRDHEALLYIDFVGDLKPNLLSVIDNGIGLRTHFEYESSTEDYLEALVQGEPWTTKLPIAFPVLARMVENVGLDLDADGAIDEYITDYSYRDGFFDCLEQEFRGFGFAQQIERGDDFDVGSGDTAFQGTGVVSAPSTVSRIRYHTGAPDGVDNDDYRDGYTGFERVDEGAGTGDPLTAFLDDVGGREEEALKGYSLYEETVDPAVLANPLGPQSFHASARRAALRDGPTLEMTDARFVYSRTRTQWRIRRLYRPESTTAPPGRFAAAADPVFALVNKSVSFAYAASTDTEAFEANGFLRERLDGQPVMYPERAPKRFRTSSQYDDYGNPIWDADYGVVDGDDNGFGDDERISRTEYVLSPGALARWMIRYPFRSRVEDESGRFVSESRYYYDGSAFVGLPLGEIGTRGLVTRQADVVTEDVSQLAPLDAYDPDRIAYPGDPRLPNGAAIDSARMAYDIYGNTIAILDPLGDAADVSLLPSADAPLRAAVDSSGAGHARVISYDDPRHIFPEEERVVVGDGKTDLVALAEYDPGFGVVTQSADWNGNVSEYVYDSFGRLVAIILPGDSRERPTRRFEYIPGDAQRQLEYRYNAQGELLGGAPEEVSGSAVNTIAFRFRENPSDSREYKTLDSFEYTSGYGQDLMGISEGETPGQWVVTSANLYNARGWSRAVYSPYFRDDSDYHLAGSGGTLSEGGERAERDVEDFDRIDRLYDPLGRPIRYTHPPEALGARRAELIQHHLPLETMEFDFEDTWPGSPHFETPISHLNDGLGRLIEVVEYVRLTDDGRPSGALSEWVTRYRSDLNDNLVHWTDSQGNVRWGRYDGLGREIFKNDPDRGTRAHVYDDASNLVATRDAKGQRIVLTYDGVNRLLTEDYIDEAESYSAQRTYDPSQPIDAVNRPDVRYIHDALDVEAVFAAGDTRLPRNGLGRLLKVVDLAGAETVSYDERGRTEWELRELKDPVTGVMIPFGKELSYDALDRTRSFTYPDGDRVVYRYNARGLIEAIEGGAHLNADFESGVVAASDYTPSGRLERRRMGAGLEQRLEYDPRQRIRALRVTSPAFEDNAILDYAYELDAVSNFLSIQDRRTERADSLRNSQTYQFDHLYRLIEANYPEAVAGSDGPPALNYRYNRIGNMLERRLGGSEDAESQRAGDALVYGSDTGRIGRSSGEPGPHALVGAGAGKVLEYDRNGNVGNHDGLRLIWDFKDRLVSVVGPRTRADYVYGHDDMRRVRKIYTRPENSNADWKLQEFVLYPNAYYEVRDFDEPFKYVWLDGERIARATGRLDLETPGAQRIRLTEGWNLVSVLVSSGLTLSELGFGITSGEERVARWRPDDQLFELLSPTDVVSAGDVLWVYATNPRIVTLSGDLPPESASTVNAPGGFIGPSGFESLRIDDFLNRARWLQFDSASQLWTSEWFSPERSDERFTVGRPVFVPAEGEMDVASRPESLQIQYYVTDHLGSSNVMTDALGAPKEEVAYFPFGAVRDRWSQTDADDIAGSTYTYLQNEIDDESGLACFNARYLALELGRFLSVDPIYDDPPLAVLINPQLGNPYAYAKNSPLTYSDADGEFLVTAVGVVVGGITGGAIEAAKTKNQGNRWSAFKSGAARGLFAGAVAGAITEATVLTGGSALVGALGGGFLGSGLVSAYDARPSHKSSMAKVRATAFLVGGIISLPGSALGVGVGGFFGQSSAGAAIGSGLGGAVGTGVGEAGTAAKDKAVGPAKRAAFYTGADGVTTKISAVAAFKKGIHAQPSRRSSAASSRSSSSSRAMKSAQRRPSSKARPAQTGGSLLKVPAPKHSVNPKRKSTSKARRPR